MKTKQIISMLCTAAMLLSGSPAYAEDNSLDFLLKEYNSIEGKIKISAKLNKPLEILSKVPVGGDYIDLQRLVESAVKGTVEYSYKTKTDLDNKKIQLEMTGESKLPLVLNKNLDAEVNARHGMWLNLDFGNSERPVYEITIQNPVFNKYINMDVMSCYPTYSPLGSLSVIGGADGPTAIYVADSAQQIEEAYYNPADVIDTVLDRESYAEMQKRITAAMRNNSTVVKNGNKVTVTFTDKGAKRYIADSVKTAYDSMETDYRTAIENYDEVKVTLKKLFDVPIFAENEAMKFEYLLDSNGYIKSVKTTVNIKTNVFELITAIYGSADAVEFNHDKSVVDLTVFTETEYSSVNKDIKITFPELTEENTFNPYKPGDMTEIEDGAFDFSMCSCEYYDMYINEAKIDGNKLDFKLRDVFDGADIDYSNGKIVITKGDSSGEDYDAYIWYNDFFDKSIIINVGSDTVFIDDKAKTVSDIPYVINDRTYVSNRFIEEITGLKLNYIEGVPYEESIVFTVSYEKECDYCKRFFSDT